MPCALPFKYNNKWYSECTTEGLEDHLQWCATTTRYDENEKWGFCPVQGKVQTRQVYKVITRHEVCEQLLQHISKV